MTKFKICLSLIILFNANILMAQEVTTNKPASHRYDPQDKNVGLGVIIGEPTGFSAKVNTGPTIAFDLGLAWAFNNETALHLHGDILNHARNLFQINGAPFDLHYGIGMRFKFNENNDDNVGIRIPVGLNYMFASVPIETFFEIAPIIDLTPSTNMALNVGIGARYFF